MSFWQFATNVFNWFEGRTTRIIGLATGTLVTLTGTGIIPEAQLKYWMAAIAVLTYWRGSSTAKTYSSAQAIVKQAAVPDVPLVPTPILKEPAADPASTPSTPPARKVEVFK
jgi:hypothetical protein